MIKSSQHTLLGDIARSSNHDNKNYVTSAVMLKTIVGLLYSAPFLQPTVEIIKERPIPGSFLAISLPCIFAIGYTFYGQHVLELFNPQEAIHHIGEDLGLNHEQIDNKQFWELRTKLAIFLAVSAATFPLGLTKVDLDHNKMPLYFYLKLVYLAAYSAMEACPHVNHWQFWPEAFKKFLSLAWQYKIWVAILILGHGLNDIADLWNAKGFWFPWAIVGIAIEFFLPLIESIAHGSLKLPEKITLTTIAPLLGIFYGAYGIAVFNWYNTFNDLNFFVDNSSRITLFILENITTLFLVFEVQDHALGKHDHDHNTALAQGDIELHNCVKHDPNIQFCLEANASVCANGFHCRATDHQGHSQHHTARAAHS